MTENYSNGPCHGCGSTNYEKSYVINGTGDYCGKCPEYHKLKVSELERHAGSSIPYTAFSGGYF